MNEWNRFPILSRNQQRDTQQKRRSKKEEACCLTTTTTKTQQKSLLLQSLRVLLSFVPRTMRFWSSTLIRIIRTTFVVLKIIFFTQNARERHT